jgi:AcrR family transcriptional regulator
MHDLNFDDLLAKSLTPGQFKFTSQQGRTRRLMLLQAASSLLCERDAQDVSLADVCERAGIPRASAYHFFSNIKALFLGLRVLHAESLLEAAHRLDAQEFELWGDYFNALIDTGAHVMRSNVAAAKLIYGNIGDLTAGRRLGQALDSRLAQLALAGLTQRFQLPPWEQQEQVFAVGFTLVDSVLRLSWRQHGDITDWMVGEAKRAALSYLRNYVPEYLPRVVRSAHAA